MNEPTLRYWEVFFEVYEALPRQGPGNRDCAARALGLCRELPPSPAVLDMGCGTGGQTIHLAELTTGFIIAIDTHGPSIDRLTRTVADRGLSHRIRPMVGDMAHPSFPAESFDLVWSEGALYQVGIENALGICRSLLRRGGYLAFTDAVWRKPDPLPEVKALFDQDYPGMGWVIDIAATIERCELELFGHFTLPDEAWWDDFYFPMQGRVRELRDRYADDAEALSVLEQIGQEPDLHRQHSAYYAYEFFVARRVT